MVAKDGNIEFLVNLREKVGKFQLKKFISQRIFIAHIVSKQAGDIVQMLTENVDQLDQYMNVTTMKLVQNEDPDMYPQLEDLVVNNIENSGSLFSLMFNQYVQNGRVEEAKNLISQYPDKKKNIGLINVLMGLGRDNSEKKEEIVLGLKDIFTGDEDSPKYLGQIFSNLIDMKCKAGDWEAGLAYYKQALEEGVSIDGIAARTLLTLESQLQHNKQPLPWTAGSVQDRTKARQQAQDSSDSSDSSDSDSDSEQGKSKQ